MKTITRSNPSATRPHVLRRVAAEFVGTGLLVTVVVGSGIAAQRLSPGDVGLQLLENSVATALGLTVLILMLGPVSGAHFNPVVSLADWLAGRREGAGLPLRDVAPYLAAQVLGGAAGTLLAGVMFDAAPALSGHDRATGGHLVGELVATAGLVLLVFALARAGNGSVTAAAVGAYIGAAYWFTSSTSFANPAVTIARMFTDTFAGIAPASVAPFILAQLVGGALGLAMLLVFYPTAARTAGDVVVPTQPETTS
ncbi:MIP/aquaporin family protein [Microbacterium sp. SCN 69-37]|jgi:glycerol uptake facilitator-like aquaporin|uniref:aquaporin n=1 Tax=Microbacterium sp. SCN 69-37 TaxID=1660115 RepID=UPI0002588AC0|nr:MIP/aquaporin family protein [Microbacterium sp. SCN 69-37]EIC08497.1 major intrinsic protein [Microbacterium laevaniformans OR221]ODT21889.1 MAG: MIP family protein [Microbacterium sp. SCN 69-37]